jgi:virginiamycin B lyase
MRFSKSLRFGLGMGAAALALAGSATLGAGALSSAQLQRSFSPDAAGRITEYQIHYAPAGIAAGPDGALWFAGDSAFNGWIGRITTAGKTTRYFVPAGYPDRITAGPDGALWFTAPSTGPPPSQIGRIDTGGRITQYPLGYDCQSPGGIATDRDGALWFAGKFDTICRITTRGRVSHYRVPRYTFPYHITAGPDGALWFSGAYAKVWRMTTDGKLTGFALPSPSAYVGGLTSGPDGAIWFTESLFPRGKIGRITTAGGIVEFDIPNTPGKSSTPMAIAVGPDRALWFTEVGNRFRKTSRIGRVTVVGQFSEFDIPKAPNGLADPEAIAAGPDGAMWFSDVKGHNIGRITTDIR